MQDFDFHSSVFWLTKSKRKDWLGYRSLSYSFLNKTWGKTARTGLFEIATAKLQSPFTEANHVTYNRLYGKLCLLSGRSFLSPCLEFEHARLKQASNHRAGGFKRACSNSKEIPSSDN